MIRYRRRPTLLALLAAVGGWIPAATSGPEPLRYSLTIRDTATQRAEVRGVIPTSGDTRVELMMPVWSPGFYRVEDYASRVQGLEAEGADGTPLAVSQPRPNVWLVEAGSRDRIIVTYRLLCDRRSVTTNEIAEDYAVLNPAGTLVAPRRTVEARAWPIELRLELPAGWTTKTALPALADGQGFVAPDYETLVDSPILSGQLVVHEFGVAGVPHVFVDAGEVAGWDGSRAVNDLRKVLLAVRDYWGSLPFGRYVFLNVFRAGGGGLEHKDSTLLTASSERLTTPSAYLRWLGFVTHEYVHAFNAKRLRPVELGPFDYERPPRTTSLWIAEGLTSYVADLVLRRSGASTRAEFLAALSAQIRDLQGQPGRLVQSVEQSSLEVWDNSLSGIRPTAGTVSYYVKGAVLGFLLDARIRSATAGRRSLDDLMRVAYRRHSASRGFSREEFHGAASELAGEDLSPWFRRATASTEELDYGEALDWFGLRFVETTQPEEQWRLTVREDATSAQRRHLTAWIGGE